MISGKAKRYSKRYESRRFVAIVPYRTNSHRSIEILNAFVNTAALLLWIIAAAVFTMVKVGMQFYVSAEQHRPMRTEKVSVFFGCLAGVLGNSAGTEKCSWKSQSFLVFVIGVSALLTSTLFTGVLVEQLLQNEPQKQIETLAELLESNISLIVCYKEINPFSG